MDSDFSLNWNRLAIDKSLLSVVEKQFGFANMTPVQAAVIPLFVGSKDVIVEAVTGSGKTLAFLLPLLQIIIKKNNDLLKSERRKISKFEVSAIVISPTRELASQTFRVLQEFVSTQDFDFISSMLLIGGNSLSVDVEKFRENGAHILVATPGRLCDLLDKFPELSVAVRKNLEVLILDEADILLEMGFEKSLNRILSYLPKQRRTGLFSATQTKQLTQLIRAGLRNPVKIEIKTNNVPKDSELKSQEHLSEEGLKSVVSTGLHMSPYLANNYVTLDSSCDKIPFIIQFFQSNPCAKYLLFFACCAEVDYFSKAIDHYLNSSKISVFKIHRKLRKKRQNIFDEFRKCETNSVLLCTDVMSRGVDIPEVDWVIHYDLPNTLQSYIHRSGRSGHQVGQRGKSLLLCLTHEMKFVNLCIDKGIKLEKLDIKCTNLISMRNKLTKWMKNEARKCAKFYENGMKAFVSFVRTYSSKNIMSETLFRDIDVVDLANSYGLIKLPFMPELKGKLKSCPSSFLRKEDDKEVANKHKEEMQDKRTNRDSNESVNQRRLIKQRLKQKRQRMKKKINSSKLKGEKKKKMVEFLEMKELQEDAKIVKKLKKGKISEQQFDEHFGI